MTVHEGNAVAIAVHANMLHADIAVEENEIDLGLGRLAAQLVGNVLEELADVKVLHVADGARLAPADRHEVGREVVEAAQRCQERRY